MFDLLDRAQVGRRDALEPTQESGQRADVRVDRRTPVVFEKIIVDVNPIQGGPGGVYLIEEREVVVYEVR
jgi:hypothetical protein